MATFPPDIFDRLEPRDDPPAGRRELVLFGGVIELDWRPERAVRKGAPTAARASFRTTHVERILATEVLWSDAGYAVTPNRFPFAHRHGLLWSRRERREPDARMLATAFALTEPRRATVLGNSIGAAASLPRAHLHLIDERLPFLRELATEPWRDEIAVQLASAEPDVELRRAAPPFPALLVAVAGPPAGRARVVGHLLAIRGTPAFNLVDQDGVTWLLPRSPAESPTPHFPQALGAAELWGRWCFQDQSAFEAADSASLTRALQLAGRTT